MSTRGMLGTRINEEFNRIIHTPEKDTNHLCELLLQYLPGVIGPLLNHSRLCQLSQSQDDVLQMAIEEILVNGMRTFNPDKGKFATYCGKIASNVCINIMQEIADNKADVLEEELLQLSIEESEKYPNMWGRSPESVLLQSEEMQKFADFCKEWTLKYLDTYMNLDYPVHKMVGSAYSLILSKKSLENTKDLSSPKWACEVLGNKSVEAGSQIFIDEMNRWIPYLNLSWGENFEHAKEEILFGKRTADVVYGEHFVPKHFENWDTGIRAKIRKTMGKEVFDKGKHFFSP